MRNSKRLLIALVAVLTIGVSAGFAWSGTGTGLCWSSDSTEYFTAFKEWSGSVQWDTTKTPWEATGFAGTWEDGPNDESGTFSGTWVRTNDPNTVPGEYTSVGTWTRLVNQGGGQTCVEWGNYTINFTIPALPQPGTCTGTWTVTYTGWEDTGNETISGSSSGGT